MIIRRYKLEELMTKRLDPLTIAEKRSRKTKIRRKPRDEIEKKMLRRVVTETVQSAENNGRLFYDEEKRRRIRL